MKFCIRSLIISTVLATLFLTQCLNAQEGSVSKEQELGKVSIAIHPFEYFSDPINDPEEITWTSRHKLGEPQGFIVRIYPVNEEFKKIQREQLRKAASLPAVFKDMLGGDVVLFRPKSFEELLEWLQKGWALELAVKPTTVNERIVFKVPAGEYFFNYAVEFKNRMGIDILFPAVRTMRENDSNLPLWGPLHVTVSKGETTEVDISPTYKNFRVDLGFDFVRKYMSEIIDQTE